MVNGQECIVCALYGTEQCRIHTEKQEGCATCPALAAIYNQLYELLSVNSKNGSELNQTIVQIYQMIKGAKNEFDIEKSQIDKNIDELTTNLEQLRKYEVTPVKTK